MVLNKIWRYGDASTKVEVFEVNATTMRFQVSNPKFRENILNRGIWNIAGVPMVVTKWTPRTEEEKKEDEAIPMWVHLHRVPLHMFSWEDFRFISSAVGFLVKLHPKTIACSNFEVAKIFVKVDVSKPLPKEINFTKNGKEFVVYFPDEVCALKRSVSPRDNAVEDEREMPPIKQQDLNIVDEVSQKENSKEAVRVEELVEVVMQSEEERVGKKDTEVVVEANWSLVSPAKAGRSPVRLAQKNQIEGNHISASKFAILSVEEEEEGEIMGEKQQGTIAGLSEASISKGVERENEVEANQTTSIVEEQAIDAKGKIARREPSISKELEEKKAKSQDANPMVMSRRSSRCHH